MFSIEKKSLNVKGPIILTDYEKFYILNLPPIYSFNLKNYQFYNFYFPEDKRFPLFRILFIYRNVYSETGTSLTSYT